MSSLSTTDELAERVTAMFPQSRKRGEQQMILDPPRVFEKSSLIATSKILGNGVYAVVEFGQLRTNETDKLVDIAIKKPRKRGNSIAQVNDEIMTMSCLNHQNVLKLIGFVHPELNEFGELPWILTEYMDSGTLVDFMRENPEFCNDVFKVKAAKDIAAGMKYLSVDKSIVHGDLHGNNCFVANCGEIVKIGDFGFSFKIRNEGKTLNGPVGTSGRPQGDVLSVTGARWKAPEWIPGKNYRRITTRPGDVWAYAILLFELWNDMNVEPYDICSDEIVCEIVSKGYNPLDFSRCDAPALVVNIMQRCFALALVQRPNFAKIVEVFPSLP